jgi:ketosteroid isomerase-like protein
MAIVEPSDYVAILDLISRYSRTFDSNDVTAFANLFTDDARLDTPVGNPASRSEIETWARDRWAELRKDGIRPTHFQTNTVLDTSSPDHATGSTQLLLVWHHASTNKSELTGTAIYEDEFQRTDRGWKFLRRSIGWGDSTQEKS